MNEKMRRFAKSLIIERNSVVGSIPMAVMLAGKHTQEEQTPNAYLYGTATEPLPDIFTVYTPELQKTHPYALLWPVNSDGWYRLLISSELPYAVTTDNGNYLHFAGQYGFCDNSPKPYKWTDIDCYAGPHTGYAPGAVVWSNFDLYYEDGTLVCAASEPVPTTSWDYVIATKFDGEVTTVANDDGTACVSDYQLYADGASLYSSCAYRITVDRATTVEDIQGSYSLGHYLGNPYLADSANFEDNGGAWCIKESTKYVSGSGFLSVFYFYTKEPGTYQLKLESVRG